MYVPDGIFIFPTISHSSVNARYSLLPLFLFSLIPSSYILLNRFIIPRILTYPPKRRILLVLLSILFGIFIVLITNQPRVYFLLPRHSLTIQVPASADPSGDDRVVAITGFSNGWEDVSFSQFRQTGSWQRESNRIYHVGSSAASLQWTGRVNIIPAIIFEKSPNAGSIDVIWDGQAANIFLSGNAGESETISSVFGDNQGYLFQSVLYIIIASFLFLWITILLLEIKINQKRDSSPLSKYSWLFYTLPMVCGVGDLPADLFPGDDEPGFERAMGSDHIRAFQRCPPGLSHLIDVAGHEDLVIPGGGRDLSDPFPESNCRLGDPPA